MKRAVHGPAVKSIVIANKTALLLRLFTRKRFKRTLGVRNRGFLHETPATPPDLCTVLRKKVYCYFKICNIFR